MANSNRLELPLLSASQAQKHVTMNESLKLLDAIVQAGVIDKDLTAPPGSPSEGDIYIVGASATGDWASQDDDLAIYQDGAWTFVTPLSGWIAWVADETTLYVYSGGSWILLLGSAGNGSAGSPAYSFSSDTDTGMYRNAANELGFATGGSERLKITNTQVTATVAQFLLTDQGSDANFTISKQAVADDAVLTFQTNFSTRGILGLSGNDDFVIKVSPDGASFTDAITVDKDDGTVSLAGLLRANYGSAATPGISFNGDGNTGIYRNANDEIGFATGGSERFKITNTQITSSVGNFLLNNAGSDSSATINKSASGDDATLNFQTGFSHYASLGLQANNDFTLKVGTSFTTALVAEENTGHLLAPSGVGSTHITIADDAVGYILPPKTGGIAIITMVDSSFPQSSHSGCVAYDVGGSPNLAGMFSGTQFTALGTTALTGTTGTRTSVAVNDDGGVKKLAIENRFGSTRTYSITFIGGELD